MTRTDLREQLGNIDRIRDILFGTQLRDYNARFERLEKGLTGLQQDVRSRADEVRQALSSELKTAVESIEQKMRSSNIRSAEEKLEIQQQLESFGKRIDTSTNELQDKLATDVRGATDDLTRQLQSLRQREEEKKDVLQQQVDLLHKRLSENAESLNEALGKQNTALRDDLLETREKLQEAILTLKDHLYADLEQAVSQLSQAKVAREDMAELLFELGMRLKGAELLPELSELSKIGDTEAASSDTAALPSSDDVFN